MGLHQCQLSPHYIAVVELGSLKWVKTFSEGELALRVAKDFIKFPFDVLLVRADTGGNATRLPSEQKRKCSSRCQAFTRFRMEHRLNELACGGGHFGYRCIQ